MPDLIDERNWIERYSAAYRRLRPNAPVGQLAQVAETYWYYLRHRVAESVAFERAGGMQVLGDRVSDWIKTCAAELQRLQPALGQRETLYLAKQMWDTDSLHLVDPHVMARALSERLELTRDVPGHLFRADK